MKHVCFGLKEPVLSKEPRQQNDKKKIRNKVSKSLAFKSSLKNPALVWTGSKQRNISLLRISEHVGRTVRELGARCELVLPGSIIEVGFWKLMSLDLEGENEVILGLKARNEKKPKTKLVSLGIPSSVYQFSCKNVD